MRKFLVIKIIIAFVILFFLIRFINYDEIISAFRKADFLLLLIGVLLFIPNIMMQLLKWRFLLNLGNPSIKTPEVIKSFFAGFSVGMVTPGRVGEISRAFFIRGSDRIKILGYTIIDRVYSLLVTILFGLLSVAYLLVFNFKFSIFLLIPILVITFFFLFVVLYFSNDFSHRVICLCVHAHIIPPLLSVKILGLQLYYLQITKVHTSHLF